MVTPLGIGREENWAAAVAGRSGAGPITLFEPLDTASTIACEVTGFEPTDFIDHRSARRMDRFSQVRRGGRAHGGGGRRASTITDALRPRVGGPRGQRHRRPRQLRLQQTIIAEERGPDRVSPLFIPMVIANMAAAQVSMELGLRGPLSCVSTACASGNHALGDATEVIRARTGRRHAGGGRRGQHHPRRASPPSTR